MDHFIDYLATKREMADALRLVIAAGTNPFAQSRDRLLAALNRLLAAARRPAPSARTCSPVTSSPGSAESRSPPVDGNSAIRRDACSTC